MMTFKTTFANPPIHVKLANIPQKQNNEAEFEQLKLFQWEVKDQFCESHNLPNSQLRRREGLICLNDLWRFSGEDKSRIPSSWMRQKQTQILIKTLQNQVKGHIYTIYRGRYGGTFAVDEVAYKYWEYLSIKRRVKLTEQKVQHRLAKTLYGAKCEVLTLAGKIDILTNNELIEVKSISNWKCAIGQVLVYGMYYPKHQKRIHLFGESPTDLLSLIRSSCASFDIEVTWEN